jgi:tRNA pseudouridine38-40 synthase
VQGTLAKAIHRITGETVLPQGSGRTDTGVHALGQVVSFSIATPIPRPNLQRALNNQLPGSIRIVTLEPAPANFHARFSTRRKTYEYRICPAPVCPPTLAPFVWNCIWPLNLEAMQQAAAHVVGSFDFASFAATDPDLAARDASNGASQPPRSTVRTIFASSWERTTEPHGCDVLAYRVTGSGFLHHMVRNLVGTFVDIGKDRTLPDAIPGMIAAKARSAAGPTAPPQGLFLVSVEYDQQ